MSEPFIGEVRLVGFNFQPEGWNICNGRILDISQNTALFQLLGTYYGGDGVNSFQLPDLRGRTPIHQGTLQGGGPTFNIGQIAGTENVSLTSSQLPAHTHSFQANTTPPTSQSPLVNVPTNNTLGAGVDIYEAKPPGSAMGAMLTNAGSSVPHNNMQPYLVLNWIIALFGLYPSQG
ncbi:MAG TPA: tail fiber protein [Terracidiphilus sp.]|nr:tail fiber protein [Terracidiphilus sp.]